MQRDPMFTVISTGRSDYNIRKWHKKVMMAYGMRIYGIGNRRIPLENRSHRR